MLLGQDLNFNSCCLSGFSLPLHPHPLLPTPTLSPPTHPLFRAFIYISKDYLSNCLFINASVISIYLSVTASVIRIPPFRQRQYTPHIALTRSTYAIFNSFLMLVRQIDGEQLDRQMHHLLKTGNELSLGRPGFLHRNPLGRGGWGGGTKKEQKLILNAFCIFRIRPRQRDKEKDAFYFRSKIYALGILRFFRILC